VATKSATNWQQTGNKSATCSAFLPLIAFVANFGHLCRADVPMSGWFCGGDAAATLMPSTMNRPEPF
jgi:hypothetical protein